MTKTLDTSQQDYSARATLAPVVLAKIEVKFNYGDVVPAKTFYYSWPGSCYYDWPGSATHFEGVISEISAPSGSIPWPPQRRGFSSRSRLALTVANGPDPIDGQWRWRSFRQRRLHRATIEVAELLVPPSKRQVDGSSAWWDLRDLAGTEHTIVYRGELDDATGALEDFELEFATREPEVPVLECLVADENDPRDFGAVMPIVYGEMKRVPLRNLKIGHQTTLAEALTADETGVKTVTDASGFPTATTFDFICGSEIIECSGSDHTANTVTITTRGHDDTAAAMHAPGDQMMELVDEVVLGIAGHWIFGMPALYLANPFNQELTRYTGYYLYRRGDQRGHHFGFGVGAQFSTVTIAREDFVEWLIAARTSARVSVQAEYDGGGGTPGTPTATPDDTNEEAAPGGIGYGVWSGTASSPVWTATAGADRVQLRGDWDVAQNTDTIQRFRFKLQATLSGWTSGEAKLRCKGMNMLGCFADPILLTATGNGTYTGYTNWLQPTNKTLDNLRTDNEEVVLQPSGATGCVWTVNEWKVEAETNPGQNVTREVDAEIEAAATGYGLQFYADVDGVFVPYLFPSTSYAFEEGASGTWNTSGGTQTRSTDETEGTYSQQLTNTADTAIMQYLSPGGGSGVNLVAQDDFYLLDLKADDVANIVSARIWFANSGTGTTVPADRIELEIPAYMLVEDTWITIQQIGVRYGSPDVSDCDCIGMEIIRSSGTPSIKFDDLRVAAATNGNYDGAPGSLIEKGPDIIRHFLADHCGLGHGVVDDTSFDLALTNLGTDKFAALVTGLGEGFDEIVGALGYETRSQVVRTEGASDTVYKLVTSTTSLGYPSTVRDFESFLSVRERILRVDELGNKFRGFWEWSPFLGNSEEGFAKVSRVDDVVNDTSIPETTVNAALDRLGPLDPRSLFFLTIRDETTAEDVFEWYVRAMIGLSRLRYIVEVPAFDCYDLEPGDTVNLAIPWQTIGPPLAKALVLGVFRTPGEPTGRVELIGVS